MKQASKVSYRGCVRARVITGGIRVNTATSPAPIKSL
jgi:hypothetical protein